MECKPPPPGPPIKTNQATTTIVKLNKAKYKKLKDTNYSSIFLKQTRLFCTLTTD